MADQLRFGVIGAGGFALTHAIPAMLKAENCRVQAVMVRDRKRAQEIADQFGVPEAYASVEELVASPAVEAVYICSPDAFHHDHALLAVMRGKHILCEKPLAPTVHECREMMGAARAREVKLAPAFMMRFHPVMAHVKKEIKREAIGVIKMMRITCEFDYPSCGNWRQEKGGALFDLGSHAVDLVRFLCRQEVFGVNACVGTTRHRYPASDFAHLLLRFNFNEASATVSVSFAAPCYRSELEVFGTNGVIRGENIISRDVEPEVSIIRGGGRKIERIEFPEGVRNRYTRQFESFASSVLNEDYSPVNDSDGLAVTAILEAAITSSQRGGRLATV